jgi:ubiquinone/menaquinone biosynthesis C-methylase UbiE
MFLGWIVIHLISLIVFELPLTVAKLQARNSPPTCRNDCAVGASGQIYPQNCIRESSMSAQDAPTQRDHKSVVREEFTRQADAFAAAAVITNEDRLARLVAAVKPAPSDRALEVATGPGYVALALARRCREVIGLDLTEALLRIAERNRHESGIANVHFQSGDAEHLPFSDGEFDIVVCRFAFHHFENPGQVLAEMCRACRVGGTVAVEDLYASEYAERAAYWNRIERLRDHSHTRALALSKLVALVTHAGIEIQRLYSDELTADVEAWLEGAKTSASDAAEVRRLLEDDMREDRSGIHPFMHGGRLHFFQRTVALAGRKLAP